MILSLFKVLHLFLTTLKYLLLSFIFPDSVIALKQRWAQSLLRSLGYKIQRKGEPLIQNKLILVGNHVSFLDILVIMAVHPEVVFVAKKEIKSWPIIGWAARRIGTIFVNRNNKESRALTKVYLKNLFLNTKHSLNLVIFPSGTTLLVENKIWKKGIFEIAQETKTPIQPFFIDYNPLRPSAYIDDDHLLLKMMELFRLKNKTVTLHWGESFSCDDPILQTNTTRLWTLQEALCQS